MTADLKSNWPGFTRRPTPQPKIDVAVAVQNFFQETLEEVYPDRVQDLLERLSPEDYELLKIDSLRGGEPYVDKRVLESTASAYLNLACGIPIPVQISKFNPFARLKIYFHMRDFTNSYREIYRDSAGLLGKNAIRTVPETWAMALIGMSNPRATEFLNLIYSKTEPDNHYAAQVHNLLKCYGSKQQPRYPDYSIYLYLIDCWNAYFGQRTYKIKPLYTYPTFSRNPTPIEGTPFALCGEGLPLKEIEYQILHNQFPL